MDSWYFFKEFHMSAKGGCTRKHVAFFFAGLVGIAFVSWGLGRDVSTWTAMSFDQLQSTRVGLLANNKCCVRPAYTKCSYSCVFNPYCPAGVVTHSTCGASSCPTDPDSTCNKAAFANHF